MKTQVFADTKQNRTGVYVTTGDVLYFDVQGTWRDATISCDADGWTGTSVLPFASWIYDNSFLDNQKVVPGQPYMKLIVQIGKTRTPIGPGKRQIVAPSSGEIILFANDIPWLYWNNSGSLFVEVA